MKSLSDTIHGAAVALRKTLFPGAVAQEAFIGDAQAQEAHRVAEAGMFAWTIARERARQACGTSSAAAAVNACERREMASAEIPVASDESKINAVLEDLGPELDAALAEVIELTEEGTLDLDSEAWPAWVEENGALFDQMFAAFDTEPLGDRVFVVGYGRDGHPVSSHMRSCPRSGDGLGGMLMDATEVTFGDTLTASAEPGVMRFGQHSASPPPNCLTGIVFPAIVRLNERTPDGRLIQSGGFSIRNLPEGRALSFKTMFADSGGGHVGSVISGLVDEVTVDASGLVSGKGWLLDSAAGRDSGKMIQAGALTGNSIDLSAEEYKVDVDWETMKIQVDFVKSKMAATTLVATPAMEGCSVELEDPSFDFGAEAKVLVAAAVGDFADGSFAFTDTATVTVEGGESDAPEAPTPPAKWFTEIEGDAYPVRVEAPDANGFQEVHGFVFEQGKPHIGLEQHGIKMTPPVNHTDYAYFCNGEVLVDDGTFVATGRLLIGGKHAPDEMDWREAQRHYDDVSDGWADVAMGENSKGHGWVHGYVRPGTDPNVVAAARASGTSGDWRRIGGRLEMIAVLSVNVEGFPKARPSGFVRNGRAFSMVGAGSLAPEILQHRQAGQFLTTEDYEALRAMGAFAQREELKDLESDFLADQRAELESLEGGLV